MSRTPFRLVRGAALALVLAAAPVHSVFAEEPTSIEARAESLKPGEFVWQPERAESGEVEVVVSLPDQRAYVYRAGTLIGVTTISSGTKGRESPLGAFTVLEKKVFHRSNRYNDAPMPHMQRLNWYGIALHAGEIPGYPASHGCVRLPSKFAKLLYGATSVGTRVVLIDLPVESTEEALQIARLQPLARTAGGAAGAAL